jgi:hypothetical protein
METGTVQSVRNIFTGTGSMTDFIGAVLWFTPVHAARNQLRRPRREKAKNEENPQARTGKSKTPRREGKFEAFEKGRAKKTGETNSTRIGKEVHKRNARRRRASGEFDEVNSPIKDKSGEPILVPKRVNLETGEPQPGTRLQDARPDAVSYQRGRIVDDKPVGRPIRKDRQEIIRFLEAYKQREGVYPETIEIHRYDPNTVRPAGVERYTPGDFLP